MGGKGAARAVQGVKHRWERERRPIMEVSNAPIMARELPLIEAAILVTAEVPVIEAAILVEVRLL